MIDAQVGLCKGAGPFVNWEASGTVCCDDTNLILLESADGILLDQTTAVAAVVR